MTARDVPVARAGEAPLAVGWATVELGRAAMELASLLVPGAAFEPAPACDHLGARCLVGRATGLDGGAPLLVLLEPSTEGRLAAALARRGEGWCATWVAGPAVTSPPSPPHEPRGGLRDGPLGPESLEPGAPVGGPYRLVVSPATIV